MTGERQQTTLRADGVGVRAGTARLLRPTTVEVGTGELVALIGPSGSGKTTLLRALAGVIQPSEGTVTLGGRPIADHSHDIGYLPYGMIVHDLLTVREALRYTAILRLPDDPGDAVIDARIKEVLSELRLTDRADGQIRSLSSGERKRASVAVELMADPDMLLLDEPATGLDPRLERELMLMMRRLADHGRGVCVVTHATSSLELADRVAVMAPGGKLLDIGKPQELLERFGVRNYDEIYEQLGPAEDIEEDEGYHQAMPDLMPRPAAQIPSARQAYVLTARYAKVFRRDTRTLTVLLGQAPVIGFFMGAVLPRDVLQNSGAFGDFYGIMICFLIMTGSFWLGLVAAGREIVKERQIVEHEAAAGVRPGPYLLSKLLVLFPLAMAQVILLAGVVVVLQPLGEPSSTYMAVFALCILVSWGAVTMGLALSARARTADQASAAVPLLLIPQLLFAGGVIPTDAMPNAMAALANVVASRWALAGIGGALDFQRTIGGDVSQVAGYDPGFFDLGFGPAALALVGFIIAGLMVAASGLKRRVT